MIENDTIAAIATPPGVGGVGIIRLSGPASIESVNHLFRGKNWPLSKNNSNRIVYGHIVSGDEMVDEVLVSVFCAPHSYTAEDVVEINCHGGMFVLKKVLALLISEGVRPADPGEFTKRAFLNGRMDLSQAESVMDLISADSDFALKNSVSVLSGGLRDRFSFFREKILKETAFIESSLDDPEHFSLDGYPEHLLSVIQPILSELASYSEHFDQGQLFKKGISTVIAGKPNVGKSSLMNLILHRDRAIVTDIPGTTRDVIEESVTVGDLILRISDTAGIRETSDAVEKIGVSRSLDGIKNAELVLLVLDLTRPLDEEDRSILSVCRDKDHVIVLFNKSDASSDPMLEQTWRNTIVSYLPKAGIVLFSAKTGEGLDQLTSKITDLFFDKGFSSSDELFLSNLRQKYLVDEAIVSLKQVVSSISDSLPEDFYTIDLTDAYVSLGKILGEEVEDDLIEKIFSEFCVGK